jgi:peptidoglycan/LPS O-acetylase OafA/YrhL
MSIFLTTPALFYLFRRYPKDWWVIGAWTAVLFNIGLLSMYHNTGAHQFGYRYILDMLVPLIAMFAVGFSNRKMSWHFILAVLLSIAVNLYGADWFMNG